MSDKLGIPAEVRGHLDAFADLCLEFHKSLLERGASPELADLLTAEFLRVNLTVGAGITAKPKMLPVLPVVPGKQ